MQELTKIAESVNEFDFSERNVISVEAGGKQISIGRYNGELFAFAYKCPHAGGILSEGWIDALGNIVCPLHRYKFCMRNGRNISGEGYFLKHWELIVKGDGIYILF